MPRIQQQRKKMALFSYRNGNISKIIRDESLHIKIQIIHNLLLAAAFQFINLKKSKNHVKILLAAHPGAGVFFFRVNESTLIITFTDVSRAGVPGEYPITGQFLVFQSNYLLLYYL